MSYRAESHATIAFACAFLLSAGVCYPKTVNAQTTKTESSYSEPLPAGAATMAKQMVPAEANLDKDLDARKAQTGQQFRAKITDTVHLKNGTELPRGTTLVGKITKDEMDHNGQSMLAVDFTKAQLKDGKTIPIEATIIGVGAPSSSNYYDFSAAGAPPVPWNGTSLQVDDIGMISGMDLHSRIGGENSGTFVSKKSDMKLTAGTQLSLAIGAQGASNMGGGI
jgi:hypothetical protein